MTTATNTRKQPPVIKIGDRARIARREMKLTQPEFVALLQEHLPSVQEKAYSAWETGTTPDEIVLVSEALEKVTGYPWFWFLRGIYNEEGGPDGGGGAGVTGRYQKGNVIPWNSKRRTLQEATLTGVAA